MSDIDAEKLEQALRAVVSGTANLESECGDMVIEAARAHLATLPRWKNVEVEAWAVVHNDGRINSLWCSSEWAQARCGEGFSRAVIRLTGTARVRS